MITPSNLYAVVKAMVPLYTAMALGFVSVRHLHAFNADQCNGINHFVALYALPLLIFRMVSSNNPYAMSARLVASDTLQKVILLIVLFAWAYWANKRQKKSLKSSNSSPLQWVVTIFSLASLPNTIIMGIPLLGGMYGSVSANLMVQIVVLQFCLWYNLVIFLYEYMAAKRAILAKGHQVLPEIALVKEKDCTIEIVIPDQKDSIVDGTVEIIIPDKDDTVETVVTKDQDVAVEIPETNAEKMAPVSVQVPREPQVPTVAVKEVVFVAMKKLLKIPNTYASFLGLLWSLMAFKVGIKLPSIVDDSLAIVSTTAVGLSMFSAGTFLARQTQFISCGYSKAILSIVVRFIVGPVLMALTSYLLGLHGTLFHIAVVQAALPLAVSSFVYAEEYKLHSDIMSTGIIIGNFISLPFTILYYIVTGL
ncbi:hypothetical protein LUZ60_011165 [Juncus effusus]|nr:hypothetical protein LUZ60_011165 [Juncus effusus]